MNYHVFGKPNLPIVLRDCLLIYQDKVPILIGKVYLFTSRRSMSVREFGELWPSDIILGENSFVGFFNCAFNSQIDFLGDSNEYCTIQSSSEYNIIYKLNNVRFSRINSSFGEDSSELYIKFSCLSYDIIMQNREIKSETE